MDKIINWRKIDIRKFFILEVLPLIPAKLSAVAQSLKKISARTSMVLQTYGLSINNDDECVENRLIDDSDEIISDRKGVNYSDNMLAISPFAGDYPTTNYINYTDLDATYATQGKTSSLLVSGPSMRMQMILNMNHKCFSHCFIIYCSFWWCTLVHTFWTDEI